MIQTISRTCNEGSLSTEGSLHADRGRGVRRRRRRKEKRGNSPKSQHHPPNTDPCAAMCSGWIIHNNGDRPESFKLWNIYPPITMYEYVWGIGWPPRYAPTLSAVPWDEVEGVQRSWPRGRGTDRYSYCLRNWHQHTWILMHFRWVWIQDGRMDKN